MENKKPRVIESRVGNGNEKIQKIVNLKNEELFFLTQDSIDNIVKPRLATIDKFHQCTMH